MSMNLYEENAGRYDQEGAMRQRFLEIDDRTEDLKDFIKRGKVSFDVFIENYDISWIFHENGLEGVVLSYPEIKSAVDNKIISDVSLLPTYEDIKSQKQCIDLMREKAKTKRFHITVPFVHELHTHLVRDPEENAVYRSDIPIHRTYFHEIEEPSKIPIQLEKVLTYLKDTQDEDSHPIELAARTHHKLMRVFPFSRYSGIIGRLIMNFVLARFGYLPAVIHAADRQHYYEALRNSEKNFRGFLVDAMENSLENAFKFFGLDEPKMKAKKALS